MSRRVPAAILILLLPAHLAWGLDASSQKLADRYAVILAGNPSHEAAFERLWKIYESGNETGILIESARKGLAKQPVLSARILERGGFGAEARKALEPLAGQDAGAAMWLAGWLERAGDGPAGAALLEKTGRQTANAALLVKAGDAWQKAGQSAKARGAWEQAAMLAPHDLKLRAILARTAAGAGDPGAAIAHWRVIAEEGRPEERLSAAEEISRMQEESGNLDEAITAQEALLALLGPGHWKIASARARLYHLYERANRLGDLEARLTREAGERPADGEAALRVAAFFETQGNDRERLVWLRKAADLRSNDLSVLRNAADAELAAGHAAEAIALTDRVLELAKGDLDAGFQRAELAAIIGNEKEAEKRIAELLAAHENDEGLRARALEFYKRQRLTGALEQQLIADQVKWPGDVEKAILLARFYLEEKRFAEAEKSLTRLELKGLGASDAAEAARRIARLLHEERLEEGALSWMRKSLELEPGSLDTAMEAAQLSDALNRREEAEGVLVAAGRASLKSLPPEEVDRRYFTALEATGAPDDPLQPGQRSQAMQEMLAALQSHAVAGRSEAGWLRLSRWRAWSGNAIAAEESLRAGLKDHPESPLLTEGLADHYAAAGNLEQAIAELYKLNGLAPDRDGEILRKIGRMEINRGRADEAQRVFEDLAKKHPGDWQAIADLAAAQQAAENWFPAMERWQEAYALAPTDAKRSLRQPILAVASRLQLHERALDFLEQAASGEKDGAARNDLMREAAIFAMEQHIADAWRERLQRRSAGPQAETYWKIGLATLLKEEGKSEEAQSVVASMTEEPSAASLEAKLKAAEQAGEYDEAARAARQLARMDKSGGSGPWLRHAALLERAGHIDEAREAYRRLTTPFARDPEALVAAGDFFERQGDEKAAEDFHRKATALGATDSRILLKLGRMAGARRDRAQAAKDYEALLATSRPDLERDQKLLPRPAKLQQRDAQNANDPWARPSEEHLQGCRLIAIRELGQMLINSPTRQKWAASFIQPTERIWASYYSGDTVVALEEIQRLAEKSSVEFRAAFAALALESGQGAMLAEWASANPERLAERWQMVAGGLTLLLDRGWKPDSDALAKTVKSAPPVRRWEIARNLATRGYIRQARTMARNVPGELPDAMAVQGWLEYSNWCVALRDPEGARQALDRVITFVPESAAFTEPAFAAIHARWLLTPAQERPAYRQQVEERFAEWKKPMISAAGEALLASLSGEHDVAAKQMEKLSFDESLAESAEWTDHIQQGGRLLEHWGLSRLARDLYRRYLAGDSALRALQGEDFRKETEGFLAINKMLDADDQEVTYLREVWKARGAGQEDMLQAARRLAGSMERTKAEMIIAPLSQEPPSTDAVAGGVLTFTQNRRLLPPLRLYVERLLGKTGTALNKAMANNAGMRLAALYQQEGAFEDALTLLGKLDTSSPSAPAVILQRAQLLAKLGRHKEAVALLEHQMPKDAPANILFLADLYASLGRERDATGLLSRQLVASNPNRKAAAMRLKELAEISGDAAMLAKARVALAAEGAAGDTGGGDWAQKIQRLNARYAEPEARFQAGSQFVSSHPDLPALLRDTEMANLRRLATRKPALVPAMYTLRKNLALRESQTDKLEAELAAEWADGNYFAGEILIQLALAQNRESDLSRLLDNYLKDEHFRPVAWRQIAAELLATKREPLAERVLGELRSRIDGDAALDLMLAEALWKQGRSVDALVGPIREIAEIDPARHLDLARYYLALGLPDAARAHLTSLPPGSALDFQAGNAWAILLGQDLDRGKMAKARDVITRMAERNPEQLSGDMVANYWEASGEMSTLPPTADPFQLPGKIRREWQAEMVERLISQGDEGRAFLWIEKNPSLLGEGRARTILQGLEHTDAERALKIWDLSIAQTSLWEMRAAAAQAHLRRAQALSKAGEPPLKELEAAQKLDPGSFAIAQACANEYMRLGRTSRAAQILEMAIKSFGSPADRQAARKMLEALRLSPTLPRGA